MKICFIHTGLNGSPGAIVGNIASFCQKNGSEVSLITQKKQVGNVPYKTCSGYRLKKSYLFYKILTRTFGDDGFSNLIQTKRVIAFLEKEKPDIISLHNIHGYFLNIKLLSNYSLEHSIPIAWTLHDAWAVTGRCCYYDGPHCQRWQHGCGACPDRKNYPSTIFDQSRRYWAAKHHLINGNPNIHFITPSLWLKNVVTDSQGGYQNSCICIRNPIDTAIFYPRSELKSIKTIANGRKIIFCAAYFWNQKKGLDFINQLAGKLSDSEYIIVMAGNIPESVSLSPNIVKIPFIKDKELMAAYYSSADLFINPTLNDNAPMVNAESLACGTPVVTFSTGGSSELIQEDKNGVIIKEHTISSLLAGVANCPLKKNVSEQCISSVSSFSPERISAAYFEYFSSLVTNTK